MNSLIRLVIVDDHELMRQTWKMVLQMERRIEVVAECRSGAEAILYAGMLLPDVILMDINMTPVNGIEATKKIAESWPGVKVIATSINNQPAYVRNMLQAGARGYVTKNSSGDEMIKAIITVSEGGTYLCKEVAHHLTAK